MFLQAKHDYYQLDAMIDDEARLVRDTVRAFAQKEALPLFGEHYRAGTFPRQLIPRIAELGLLGPTMTEFGGAGVSDLAYGLMMQELERCDSGLRSFCSVQSGLVIYPSGQPFGQLAPAWILAMWPLLATTLNVSLRWLKGRYLLAALFGAIGGPLAFLAGERLGAVVFPDTGLTMIVLAVGWATLFPLLMRLSQRYDGFERRLNTSLEVSR